MEWRCAGCSIERFAGKVRHNTSARTMIRCIDFTNGKPIFEVTQIKTVPYVPLSHPFVERLIGTIRREFLDRTLFWTTADLETKLFDFQQYFNGYRTHTGLEGRLPEPGLGRSASPIDFDSYRWRKHCRGLYQTPIAA